MGRGGLGLLVQGRLRGQGERVQEKMVAPIFGFLDYWNLKFGICLLGNFGFLGFLVFWNFGLLVYWFIGFLVYWKFPKFVFLVFWNFGLVVFVFLELWIFGLLDFGLQCIDNNPIIE